MEEKVAKKKLLSIVYVAIVFFSIHYFSLYYILANYLSQYFNKSSLSLIFAASAATAILASHFFGKVLRKYTNEKNLKFVLTLQFFITLFLAFSNVLNIFIIALLAIIQSALFTLIWISINIFISEFSEYENVGAIRGTVLTIYNFGALSAPFLTSQIFNLFGYPSLFLISSLALLPILYLNKSFFKQIKEPRYNHIGLRKGLKLVFKDKSIRPIILSSFILNCFYAVLNIYLVLYLTEVLQIPLVLYLEIILPICLIPFIIVPYNLGKYSDELFGEKKAIIFGIFLLSISLFSIFLFNITTTNIFVWIFIIFLSRVGATTTETENYAYFYKKVTSRNAGLISLFQNMSNISYLTITLSGALLIHFFSISFQVIFLIMSLAGFASIIILYYSKLKLKKVKPEDFLIENK